MALCDYYSAEKTPISSLNPTCSSIFIRRNIQGTIAQVDLTELRSHFAYLACSFTPA